MKRSRAALTKPRLEAGKLEPGKFFWEKFMKRGVAALKKLARFALVGGWRLGCAELRR